MPLLPRLVEGRDRVLTRLGGRRRVAASLSSMLALVMVAVQMVLLVACAAQLASGTHNPFIYFRF